MNGPWRLVMLGVLMLGLATPALAQPAQAAPPVLAGLWDATVAIPGLNNLEVPFKFEITGSGATLAGSFFNGDVRVRSTAGRVQGATVALQFAQYGSRIDATLVNGRLEGRYDRGTRGAAYPFKAVRASSAPVSARGVPPLAGEWRIPLTRASSKGEQSWRLLLRQRGADVTGAIMRVDGDTGTLSGTFRDGKVVLSHFSGARPTMYVVTPQADGSLTLLQDGRTTLTAVRVSDARAKEVAALTDPKLYTKVRNPDEPFAFAFPDLDGRMMTNRDPRFQGKVVIVSVTGSWCPNCHDEAPFMARLYRDYRARGLEIVALAFEEPDQLKNPNRVRGFIKQYGLTYPFLLAGTPEEAPEKIPQAINLSTFPATFILGRDGKVKFVHAGYASKATGEFYEREQKAFLAEIESLLK